MLSKFGNKSVQKLQILSNKANYARGLFFLFSSLYSLEPEPNLSPWFRNLFELEAKGSTTYQYYRSIETPDGAFRNPSHDIFLDLSLATSPWPDYDVEAEFLLGRTSDIPFRFEAFRLTGRYLWFNDLWCDLFSVATGITLTFPTSPFLSSFSTPFHGEVNAAGHLAVGKELRRRGSESWVVRFYLLGGFGIANRGSPWGFAKFFLASHSENYNETYGVYLDFLGGFGNKNINPDFPFKGYRNIEYRSLDLSAFYEIPFICWSQFRITYGFRLYAHNYPQHASTLTLSLLFPFSF